MRSTTFSCRLPNTLPPGTCGSAAWPHLAARHAPTTYHARQCLLVWQTAQLGQALTTNRLRSFHSARISHARHCCHVLAPKPKQLWLAVQTPGMSTMAILVCGRLLSSQSLPWTEFRTGSRCIISAATICCQQSCTANSSPKHYSGHARSRPAHHTWLPLP